MKKISFFDIDETMVNVPNGMIHPSSETIRVITEFKNQSNYIVVAVLEDQYRKVSKTLISTDTF